MELEAQELARGLRRRDPDLLDHLIQQYHYRLMRYLLLMTGSREAAEDVFQETWIRVLEKGWQYSARWKFETWLFAITRNLAIDYLRRRESQSLEAFAATPHSEGERLPPASPAGLTILDSLAQNEEAARIAAALSGLPAAYREVLVLRFQEDMELHEIAGVLGAPLSTVKSRLYRGLEALRGLLGGESA